MARKDVYLDHLAQVPLFSACSRKELQRIASASDELKVQAGRVLTEQGAVGRECFILLEGSATVKRNGRKITTLGPGACVGELALLDHGPRTATVVTDEDSTILVLGPREFAAVLDAIPAINHKLLASLAARVRDLDARAYG